MEENLRTALSTPLKAWVKEGYSEERYKMWKPEGCSWPFNPHQTTGERLWNRWLEKALLLTESILGRPSVSVPRETKKPGKTKEVKTRNDAAHLTA